MIEKNYLEELFNKISEEKKTRELLPLAEDFYDKITLNIEKSKKISEETEKTDNIEKNIKKLLENIKKIRTQKLLLYLAYDRKLPTPIPNEEESLYKYIKNILNKTSEGIKLKKVKIINTIPEIISPEGKKLGPFIKGEIIIPESDSETEFMIKNKIGEII